MSILLTLVAVWKVDYRGVYGHRETAEDPKNHDSRGQRASLDEPAFVLYAAALSSLCFSKRALVSSFPAARADSGCFP